MRGRHPDQRGRASPFAPAASGHPALRSAGHLHFNEVTGRNVGADAEEAITAVL